MADDRIDIEIQDKVSEGPKNKLVELAAAARDAHGGIEKLKAQLASIDVGSVTKLAEASNKLLNVQARQVEAEAKLTNARAKQAAVTDRAVLTQQRVATEAARTAAAVTSGATAQQKLQAATAKTNAVVDRSGIAATQAATAQQKLATATARTAQANSAAAQAATTAATAVINQEAANNRLTASQQRATAATGAANTASKLQQTVQANGGKLSRQQLQQTQNLVYQLNDIVVGLASGQKPLTVFLQQGSQISTIFGPGNGALGTLKKLGSLLGNLFKPFVGIAAAFALLGAEFGLLNKKINDSTKVSVGFADTFKAIFQVLGRSIANVFTKDFESVSPFFGRVMSSLENTAANAINGLIALFVFFFKEVRDIFKTLAGEIGNAFRIAYNSVIIIVQGLLTVIGNDINGVVDLINDLRVKLGKDPIKPVAVIPDLSKELLQLQEVPDLYANIGKNAKAAFGVDYVKQIRSQAIKNALEPTKKELAEAARKAKALQEGLDKLTTKNKFDALSAGADEYTKALSDVNQKIEDLVRENGKLSAAQQKQANTARFLAQQAVAFKLIKDAIEDAKTPLEKFQEKSAELNKGRQFLETTEQVSTLNKAVDALNKSFFKDVIESNETPLEGYQRQMKELNAELLVAQQKNIPEAVTAIQRAMQKAADDIDPLAQAFKDFATDVGRDFSDALGKVFSRGTKGFKDMLGTFKDLFVGLLAKMATIALTQPVIVPFVQGLGSTLGLSGGTLDAITKQLGGSPLAAASNVSSIASGASTLAGLFGGGGTAAATYASVGAAAGAAPVIGAGEIAVSSLGASAGGAAAAGAGGAAATGGLGAAAGAAAPYLAAAIGGYFVLKKLGVFGGKPSDKTAAGSVSLGTGVGFDNTANSGKKFSQANTDLRNTITAFASNVVENINKTLGINLNQQLKVQIGSRDGYRYALDGGEEKNFGTDSVGLLKSLIADISTLASKSKAGSADLANLNTVLGKIDFKDTTQAFNDIQFALNFSHLSDTVDTLDEADTAMKNLNDTFHAYQLQADRVGLSVAKVNDAYKQQLKTLQTNFLDPITSSIIDDILPGYSEIAAENKKYQQQLHDAQVYDLGSDAINRINIAHQLTVKNILAQNNKAQQDQLAKANELVSTYSQLSDGFGDLIDKLTNGDYTLLSPTDNLASLRGQVQQTGAAALGGDADAQNKLLTLLPQFLDLSRDVNGANGDYAKDQKLALDYAQGAKSVAQQQLGIQQQILNAANDNNQILAQVLSGNKNAYAGNANDRLVKALQSGYTGLSNDQINSIFTTAGITVAPGEGRRTNALNSNSAANTSINSVFDALGVPRYATGGLVTGGIKGKDSVVAVTAPDEFVLKASSVRSIGAEAASYINQTGRLPSNDNGETVEAIDALTRTVAKMGDQLTELAERQLEASQSLASDNSVRRWA